MVSRRISGCISNYMMKINLFLLTVDIVTGWCCCCFCSFTLEMQSLAFSLIAAVVRWFETEDSVRSPFISDLVSVRLHSVLRSVISSPNSSKYQELFVGRFIRVSFGAADDDDSDNVRFALKFILLIALSHRLKYERILDTLLFVESVSMWSGCFNFALFSTSSIE